MKRWLVLLSVVLVPYLCTGLYVVPSDEQAVVRRFGRALKTPSGAVVLKTSGLYYDLPWPLSRIDRVNLNEVRTLTVGSAEYDDVGSDSGQFIRSASRARRAQFLTGDKNILNLQISVHYHVSQQEVDAFLFGAESAERRLQSLAESALADVVLQSGVDFVHTLGRNALRERLIDETRRLAASQHIGVEVEDVTIDSVYPPIRVKSQFLDVMNARADKQTYVNEARSYAERRRAEAQAERRKITDDAQSYKQELTEAARGKADSFTGLVAQFRADEDQGIQSYAAARHMALRRRYIESMEEIFRQVAGKVFLDSGQPVDLTIIRDPNE